MPELSVIIPVFNRINALERAVKSVLCQTYKNFELILVDDGSSDGSERLCDQLAKEDQRIIVVHQENSGVSVARNTGIRQAKGKYLTFVDSDDFIDEQMYEVMITKMNPGKNRLVLCGIQEYHYEKGYLSGITKEYLKEQLLSNNTLLDTVFQLLQGTLIHSTVNKLYLTGIIKSNMILFESGIELGEDLIFNFQYLRYIEDIYIIENCFYKYISSDADGSVSRYRDNKFDIIFRLYIELENYISTFSNISTVNINKMYLLLIKWTYSCYISLFNENCPLSKLGKYQYIKNSFDLYNGKLQFVAFQCNDCKGINKLLVNSIKSKNEKLIYFYAKLINIIKFKYHKFYIKLIKLKNK